jgi:hypothetical protein
VPRSKHRRKADKRAVKRPQRARPPPAISTYDRFWDQYLEPYLRQYPDDDSHARFLLEIIVDLAFDPRVEQARPVCKADAFARFTSDFSDEGAPPYTPAEATATLACLIDRGMVAVSGETIGLILHEPAH